MMRRRLTSKTTPMDVLPDALLKLCGFLRVFFRIAPLMHVRHNLVIYGQMVQLTFDLKEFRMHEALNIMRCRKMNACKINRVVNQEKYINF